MAVRNLEVRPHIRGVGREDEVGGEQGNEAMMVRQKGCSQKVIEVEVLLVDADAFCRFLKGGQSSACGC